jgi:hypothetical protein
LSPLLREYAGTGDFSVEGGVIGAASERRRIADLAIKHRPVISVRAAAVSLRAVDRLLISRKAARPGIPRALETLFSPVRAA